MSKNKRLALYIRCSTNKQDTAMQLTELKDWAERVGFESVEVFEDRASGSNTRRPELQRLLKLVRQRRIDSIAVWKLDRFARSLRDLVNMLAEITDANVEFHSLRDALQIKDDPMSALMVNLIGAVAQFERDLIRMRTKSGIEQARRDGKAIGRPMIRDDAKILAMARSGLNQSEIAKRLGISRGSVQNALKKVPISRVA